MLCLLRLERIRHPRLDSRFLLGCFRGGIGLRLERGGHLLGHHLVNLLLVHLYTLHWGGLCLWF